MVIRAVALGLAMLGATALVPIATAAADDLTQAEIRSELVGRQIVWWQNEGWQSGHLTLGANGSAELSVDSPQRQLDVGRWMVRGDALCTEWTTLRSAEKCYRIERGADGRFLTSGGNVFEVREAGV